MSQRDSWQSVGLGLLAASSMLGGLLAGGGLGWLADRYLFPHQPWGLLIGLLLGLAWGSRQALRIIK